MFFFYRRATSNRIIDSIFSQSRDGNGTRYTVNEPGKRTRRDTRTPAAQLWASCCFANEITDRALEAFRVRRCMPPLCCHRRSCCCRTRMRMYVALACLANPKVRRSMHKTQPLLIDNGSFFLLVSSSLFRRRPRAARLAHAPQITAMVECFCRGAKKLQLN